MCLLYASLHPLAVAGSRVGQPQNVAYVDSARGSDSNPGTSARPLKTIAKAAQMALANYQSNRTTQILIQPGTYRESISLLSKAKPSEGGITFEPTSPGRHHGFWSRRVDGMAARPIHGRTIRPSLALSLGTMQPSAQLATARRNRAASRNDFRERFIADPVSQRQ